MSRRMSLVLPVGAELGAEALAEQINGSKNEEAVSSIPSQEQVSPVPHEVRYFTKIVCIRRLFVILICLCRWGSPTGGAN